MKLRTETLIEKAGCSRRMFIAGSLAALAVSGCARITHLVETAKLMVMDSDMHAFSYKTCEQGEAELQDLACSRDTKKEEGWMFIRDEGSEVGKWLDIGYSQGEDFFRYDSYLMWKEVNKSRKATPIAVRLYHIHNLSSVIDKNREFYAGEMPDKLKQHDLEVFSVPGLVDMTSHIVLEDLLSQYPTRTPVIFEGSRVVVPTGVFTYKPGNVFRLLVKHKTAGQIVDEVFTPAIKAGIESKDIERALDVLRKADIDVSYRRTRELSL